MDPALFATRGLPGCGKSTWARAFVKAERVHAAYIRGNEQRLPVPDTATLMLAPAYVPAMGSQR